MSEYEDKMLKLRKGLPQAYKLTGTEAGTGTVTAPKGMSTKQALDYDAAIRRRMDPDRAAMGDDQMARIKAQAQESHRKKLGKSRPTFFPQEEDEDSPGTDYLKNLFGSADKRESVGGDYKLTQQDRVDDLADILDDEGSDPERSEQMARMMLLTRKNARIVARNSGQGGTVMPHPYEKDPLETAGDVYAPHAHEGVDTSDKREREDFGMDASEEQFRNEYEDQEPVSTSQTEVDGDDGWTKLEYEDGATWLMSSDGDVVRQEDVELYDYDKIREIGTDPDGKPIYQARNPIETALSYKEPI